MADQEAQSQLDEELVDRRRKKKKTLRKKRKLNLARG